MSSAATRSMISSVSSLSVNITRPPPTPPPGGCPQELRRDWRI
jgi:hypothetical protein